MQAKDAGLASGLINTSQQIGGALGIAVLSSVAIAQTNDAASAGDAVPQALTSGFQAAFWVGAGIALAGVVAVAVHVGRPLDGGGATGRDVQRGLRRRRQRRGEREAEGRDVSAVEPEAVIDVEGAYLSIPDRLVRLGEDVARRMAQS